MKIVSKTFVGKKPVYDLSVKDKEQYVFANGVVTHNTGIMYSANTVLFVTKAQEKDGTELAGFKFTLIAEKSRAVKEKSKRSSIFNKKSKEVETTSTESATVTHGGEIPNPTLTGTTIDSLLEGTVNNDVQSMGSTLSKKGITKARKKTNNGDLNINC